MPTHKPRSVALDVLRAVAILLVLGSHIVPPLDESPMGAFVATWRQGGWVGVDLFFVLSGFLVSGLLFDEHAKTGTIDPLRFLIRRGWKIYPAFYVFVLVAIRLDNAHTPKQLLSELFFLQSYIPGVWQHTWSLAVEEHFYLLLTVLLGCAVRFAKPGTTDPFKVMVPITIAVCVVELVARFSAATGAFDVHRNLYPTHLRIDSLLFGVLLAYITRKRLSADALKPYRAWLMLAGVALLAPAFAWPLGGTRWMSTVGLTLFYLGSGLLLLGITTTAPSGRAARLLGAIGFYSYSIYLWHFFAVDVCFLLLADAPIPYALRVTLYVLFAIGFGALMARVVEVPMLRLRERWFPSRAGVAATVEPPETGAAMPPTAPTR